MTRRPKERLEPLPGNDERGCIDERMHPERLLPPKIFIHVKFHRMLRVVDERKDAHCTRRNTEIFLEALRRSETELLGIQQFRERFDIHLLLVSHCHKDVPSPFFIPQEEILCIRTRNTFGNQLLCLLAGENSGMIVVPIGDPMILQELTDVWHGRTVANKREEYSASMKYGASAAHLAKKILSRVRNVSEAPRKFFVQIGAGDGWTEWKGPPVGKMITGGDSIHRLVSQGGWEGILVEPNPHVFQRLQWNYRHMNSLIFENIAVAERDGVKDFYICHKNTHLSSFSLEHTQKHDPTGREGFVESVEKIRVRCMSLSTLLQKHNMHTIDLLQIDAEGYDFMILQSLDLFAMKPRAIRYEHKHMTQEEQTACKALLEKNGYRVHPTDFLNTLASLEGMCGISADAPPGGRKTSAHTQEQSHAL